MIDLSDRLRHLADVLDDRAADYYRANPAMGYSDSTLRTMHNDSANLRRMALRYEETQP